MKFILEYKRAPGDTLVLTALVRDLKLTYGNDIEIGIRCSYPDLWKNNPYISKTEPAGAKLVRLSEGYYIRQSRAGVRQHYITAFFRDFTDKTGVVVHPTLPHGDLHLSEYEKQYPIVRGKYWVIVPGGKTDATVKVWPTSSYQEVVRLGAERNWHFVTCGLKGDAKAEERRAELINKGYHPAPPGVRAIGYEKYGDKVHIICAPPEVAKAIFDDKKLRAAIRRERMKRASLKEIEAKLRESLPKGANVAFTPVIGHGSMQQLDAEIKAVQRDVRR